RTEGARLEGKQRSGSDFQAEHLQLIEQIDLSAASAPKTVACCSCTSNNVPRHHRQISRRERRSHGPPLPPPCFPFTPQQASSDDRAENTSPEWQPHVVLTCCDHDVPNGIGRACENQMTARESEIHDRLIETTPWERAVGVTPHAQQNSEGAASIGCHGRHRRHHSCGTWSIERHPSHFRPSNVRIIAATLAGSVIR